METGIESVFVDPSFKKLNKIKFPNATSKLLVSLSLILYWLFFMDLKKVKWGQILIKKAEIQTSNSMNKIRSDKVYHTSLKDIIAVTIFTMYKKY